MVGGVDDFFPLVIPYQSLLNLEMTSVDFQNLALDRIIGFGGKNNKVP